MICPTYLRNMSENTVLIVKFSDGTSQQVHPGCGFYINSPSPTAPEHYESDAESFSVEFESNDVLTPAEEVEDVQSETVSDTVDDDQNT